MNSLNGGFPALLLIFIDSMNIYRLAGQDDSLPHFRRETSLCFSQIHIYDFLDIL